MTAMPRSAVPPRKTIVAMAYVIASLAVYFAIQNARERRGRDALLASAQRQQRVMATVLEKSKATGSTLSQEIERLSTKSVSATARVPDPREVENHEAEVKAIADAKIRAQTLAQRAEQSANVRQRLKLELTLRPAFMKLGLAAEKWEAFAAMMVERRQTEQDTEAAARQLGLTGADLQDAVNYMVAGIDEQIRATVGDMGFAKLQYLNETAPLRDAVQKLANQMVQFDLPLTQLQTEQLEQLLVNTRASLPNRDSWFGIPESVVDQARGILSEAQFEEWRRMQATQRLLQRDQERLWASQNPPPK